MAVNNIKRFNLDLHLTLPADAPIGHPHIIDFNDLDEEGPTDELHAVDAIATTLYRWNPEALQALLDLYIQDFHWGNINNQGHEHYVRRIGKDVCVGSIEIRKGVPDYEIQYSILQDGLWQITGGRDDALHGHLKFLLEDRPERCSTYDHKFAMDLITNKMWISSELNCFVFEIEGKNILNINNGQQKENIVTNATTPSHLDNKVKKVAADDLLALSRSPSVAPDTPTISKKHSLPIEGSQYTSPSVKRHRSETTPYTTPGSPTPTPTILKLPNINDTLSDIDTSCSTKDEFRQDGTSRASTPFNTVEFAVPGMELRKLDEIHGLLGKVYGMLRGVDENILVGLAKSVELCEMLKRDWAVALDDEKVEE